MQWASQAQRYFTELQILLQTHRCGSPVVTDTAEP